MHVAAVDADLEDVELDGVEHELVDRLDDVDGDLDRARRTWPRRGRAPARRRSGRARRRGAGGTGRAAGRDVGGHAADGTGGSRRSACAERRAGSVPAVPAPRFDVVGIGNALVDVIAHADDAFLAEHGLVKGSMQLIDTDRAVQPLPGARLGRRDERRLGGQHDVRRRQLRRAGGLHRQGRPTTTSAPCSATTSTPSASPSAPARPHADTPTGRCIIVVTPDAQRTMNTYLGVSEPAVGRRPRRGDDRRRRRAVHGGLPVRPRRRQEGVPPGRRRRPRATGARCR